MPQLPDLAFSNRLVDHGSDPDRIAIHDVRLGQDKTYRQLLLDVQSLKSRLLKEVQGVDNANEGPSSLKEERVAFLCPNGYAYVVTMLAVWAAEGIAVPLCLTHPANELKYTIQDSGSQYLLAHETYLTKAEELVKACPNLRLGVLKDGDSDLSASRDHDWQSGQQVRYHIDPDSRALIIYTSGSTGTPKGVVSSHRNLEAQINALSVWRFSPKDRHHHILPLHHIHGILNGLLCVLSAGGVVEMWPKFKDEEVWKRWMEGERNLTLFMAVPTIYNRLLRYAETMSDSDKRKIAPALEQFRLQISGSAALPTPTKDGWKKITGGQVLLERYGSSELGMVFSNGYEVEDRKDGTVGRPLPGVQVRLMDENGKSIDTRGVQGDLQVKGEIVFKEYWNKAEATQKEFTSDGWFKTGDRAVMRVEDGFYCILGRFSVDIIKSGGEKISALDVEREILSLDYISDVAVIGTDDPDLGQRVGAILVADRPVQIKELRNELRSLVAPYKLPTIILQIQDIPRNAMGKVQKKELVKMFGQPEHSEKVQRN